MKNRRSFLILTLLLLVLFLGVGYAVVSSVGLDIDGTADVQDADLKVSFNGVTEVSNEQKVTATAEDNSLSATIEVDNLVLNETVTAKYYIKNIESDVNARVIVDNIENNKTDYFQVTTDVDTTAKTIDAGDIDFVTITIKLIRTPIVEEDSSATIRVFLTASPTA